MIDIHSATREQFETLLRMAYTRTCACSNGFNLDSVLFGNTDHPKENWYQGKDDMVYQLFESIGNMDSPIYEVNMLHSDGGVRDWLLYQIIGSQKVLIRRYKYPFEDCFNYTTVTEMADAMHSTLVNIKNELLAELNVTPARAML